jgi:hypothetical protein
VNLNLGIGGVSTGAGSQSDSVFLATHTPSTLVGVGENPSAVVHYDFPSHVNTVSMNVQLSLHAFAALAAADTVSYTDFSNTAGLSFITGPGVTFESSSGVLLTRTNDVPEPATLLVLGACVCGLGMTRRGRSRTYCGLSSISS